MKRIIAAALLTASLTLGTVAYAYPSNCSMGFTSGSAWGICWNGDSNDWYRAYATFRSTYTGHTVRRTGNIAGVGEHSTVWGPGSPYVRVSHGLTKHG